MSTVTEPQECILKGEQYGIAISEELSEMLKKYTDNGDQANVTISLRSEGVSVGTSSIKGVIYRNNSLTETNALAIVKMVEIAKQNCEASINDAKSALKFFNKVIPNEQRRSA